MQSTRPSATTVEASVRATGDRRAGVIWHTQGSGKRKSFDGVLRRENRAAPGDGESARSSCSRTATIWTTSFLIRSRSAKSCCGRRRCRRRDQGEHLRKLLDVASGGVVFTTIQKFFPDEKGGKHPLLSDRRNIIVIADEAHRSQYDFIDGFKVAKHMRDAFAQGVVHRLHRHAD